MPSSEALGSPIDILNIPYPGYAKAIEEAYEIDLVACTKLVPLMTGKELAKALRWIAETQCYWHSELNDFQSAVCEEAAKREEIQPE